MLSEIRAQSSYPLNSAKPRPPVTRAATNTDRVTPISVLVLMVASPSQVLNQMAVATEGRDYSMDVRLGKQPHPRRSAECGHQVLGAGDDELASRWSSASSGS